MLCHASAQDPTTAFRPAEPSTWPGAVISGVRALALAPHLEPRGVYLRDGGRSLQVVVVDRQTCKTPPPQRVFHPGQAGLVPRRMAIAAPPWTSTATHAHYCTLEPGPDQSRHRDRECQGPVGSLGRDKLGPGLELPVLGFTLPSLMLGQGRHVRSRLAAGSRNRIH